MHVAHAVDGDVAEVFQFGADDIADGIFLTGHAVSLGEFLKESKVHEGFVLPLRVQIQESRRLINAALAVTNDTLDMKCRFSGSILALCVSAYCLGDWTPTNLHPSNASTSYLRAGSGSKQAGYARISAQHRAGIWSGTSGSFVQLHPAGASSSIAYGAGGTKQVGYAYIGDYRAAIWSGTAASFVDLTPAGATSAQAFGTDGIKQVGYFATTGPTRACYWQGTAASIVDLHPSGASYSSALAVKGDQKVGYATISGAERAAIWSGGAATFVNVGPAGAGSSGLNATDGTSQGGFAVFDGIRHAGLWHNTAMSFVDLHPQDAVFSTCLGVSGAFQVGYVTFPSGGTRAAVWQGSANSMVDLIDLLPANYTSGAATAIWQDGGDTVIAGYAYNQTTGKDEAVIWKQPAAETFTFALNKTQVAGQNSVQGTISATAMGTARVYTTYDNSSLVTTPASVTLAAGATVKNFQITTTAITSQINTTIYAKRGATTRSQPLLLIPLVPTALAFTPSQVVGGQPVSCRVVINGVAGPSGRTISIFDNSPYTVTPSTVSVPPGATQVTFNIATTPVSAQKTVTVTARVSAGEKTGTFRIIP